MPAIAWRGVVVFAEASGRWKTLFVAERSRDWARAHEPKLSRLQRFALRSKFVHL